MKYFSLWNCFLKPYWFPVSGKPIGFQEAVFLYFFHKILSVVQAINFREMENMI